MNLITFDLETSGLDPKVHEIIEIAAVVECGGVANYFHEKVKFSLEKADPKALEINHFDPEEWEATALGKDTMARKFARFLSPYQDVRKISKAGKPYKVAKLSGYNADAFDIKFLLEHFQNVGVFLPVDLRVLDVMQLAMWRGYLENWDLESYKLADVATRLGIERPVRLHEAMADVELTVKVRKALEVEG